jgi:hypothetical protein
MHLLVLFEASHPFMWGGFELWSKLLLALLLPSISPLNLYHVFSPWSNSSPLARGNVILTYHHSFFIKNNLYKKLYPYFSLSNNKLHGMVTLHFLDFSSYIFAIREKSIERGYASRTILPQKPHLPILKIFQRLTRLNFNQIGTCSHKENQVVCQLNFLLNGIISTSTSSLCIPHNLLTLAKPKRVWSYVLVTKMCVNLFFPYPIPWTFFN